MKERRLKAKRKRELKQQEELAIAVKEKEAIEDELEELKLATSANSEERVNEVFERRLSKMKKKCEKKVTLTRIDLMDATEVPPSSRHSTFFTFHFIYFPISLHHSQHALF